MPKLIILPHSQLCPEGVFLDGKSGETLLNVALRHDIQVEHACEMSCACTFCHCVVREGFGSLDSSHELEDDMLDQAWGRKPESRLSCQARLADGDLVVELPNTH